MSPYLKNTERVTRNSIAEKPNYIGFYSVRLSEFAIMKLFNPSLDELLASLANGNRRQVKERLLFSENCNIAPETSEIQLITGRLNTTDRSGASKVFGLGGLEIL